jgi:hypothetical protein
MTQGGLVTIPPKNIVGSDSGLSDKLGYYFMIGTIISFLAYAGYRLYKTSIQLELMKIHDNTRGQGPSARG